MARLLGGDAAAAWTRLRGNLRRALRVAHADLEQCVGQATAAFGLELLRGGRVPPGCWFPAELSGEARASILGLVREDAFVWEV